MKLEPFLVNQEFQDPVLMIPIPQRSDSVIFDLGYCFRLKVKDIQRISRIFISHTHIDHFAGFDHLLRMSVDLDKTIQVYGPPGIIRNVGGKLAGYTWNLKENIHLSFSVFEVHPDRILNAIFPGSDGFEMAAPPAEAPRQEGDPICTDRDFQVRAVFLEHKMPVLGYRIDGSHSLNIRPEALKELGLSPGKWVGEFKALVERDETLNGAFSVDGKEFSAGELARKIITKTPGTSIGYVVDTIFNKATARSLKGFLQGVQMLFCECSYLTPERDLARLNHHLTARQAATIALESGVGELYPFHFSRRYEGEYHKLYKEARAVFPPVLEAKKYGSLDK